MHGEEALRFKVSEMRFFNGTEGQKETLGGSI